MHASSDRELSTSPGRAALARHCENRENLSVPEEAGKQTMETHPGKFYAHLHSGHGV